MIGQEKDPETLAMREANNAVERARQKMEEAGAVLITAQHTLAALVTLRDAIESAQRKAGTVLR
jgi:hypothetical protein